MLALFDILSEYITPNLADDAKWNIISTGIELGYTEGISQYAINRNLRARGLHFDNNKFSEIYKEISGFRASFSYQLGIGADTTPELKQMVTSKYEITGKYGYVGQYHKINNKTGLLEPETFRIDTDTLLSRSQAEDELVNYFLKFYPKEEETIIGNIEFIGSMKNIGI